MSAVEIDSSLAGIAVVRINRPEAKNALNQSVRQQLTECFTALADDLETRCIVMTGGPSVFVAGADLKEMAECGPVDVILRKNERMWQAIARCPKPIVAAVNGYAWGGGCELAMHADIIVAGEGASFCQPEINVGIMPGAGGTQRLTRAIGKFKAMAMILTGRPVSAKEAFDMGLVSQLVADSEVLETALKMAKQIAAMPPLAVMQIKEVLLAGQDAPLDTGLALERKAFQLLFATADQKEGMGAFIDRRKPTFTGR